MNVHSQPWKATNNTYTHWVHTPQTLAQVFWPDTFFGFGRLAAPWQLIHSSQSAHGLCQAAGFPLQALPRLQAELPPLAWESSSRAMGPPHSASVRVCSSPWAPATSWRAASCVMKGIAQAW